MDSKQKNFVSAVIYVHNDENTIGEFLTMVRNVLEENFLHSDIICVNDGSTDDSMSEIKKCSAEATTAGISILNMSFYHGLELSMNAGVDLSIGDFVFEFDSVASDFPPEEIMKVYFHSLKGYDIVSASPEGKQELSSRFFYYVFNKFSHATYAMGTERFRILSRRAINRISAMNKAIPYRKAVYANSGFDQDTLYYHPISGKKEKRTSEERTYRGRLAIDALLLFTDVGYDLAMAFTGIMMVFTIFTAIYALVMYLTSTTATGWTTTILFLSFAFFCLFGILTVIMKYLQIILNLVFQRKQYTFESIEKLTK